MKLLKSVLIGLFVAILLAAQLPFPGGASGGGGGGSPAVPHSIGNVSGAGVAFPAATSTTSDSYSLTLTGTVSSSTITGLSAGEIVIIHACENSTGGFGLTLPAGFTISVDMTKAGANVCVNQTFRWDGAAANFLASTVESGPPLGGNCISTTGQGYFMPWGPPAGGSATAGNARAANVVVGWEFYVPCQMAISKIDFQIVTADNAKHIAFAIYNATTGAILTNGQSATGKSNGSNFQNLSVAFPGPVTLPVGTYNLLASSDSASILKLAILTGSSVWANTLNSLETGSSSRMFSCANASSGTTTITLPSTCGTRTVLGASGDSDDPPAVFLLP